MGGRDFYLQGWTSGTRAVHEPDLCGARRDSRCGEKPTLDGAGSRHSKWCADAVAAIAATPADRGP